MIMNIINGMTNMITNNAILSVANNLTNLIVNNIYTLGILADIWKVIKGFIQMSTLIVRPITLLLFIIEGTSLIANTIIYPLAAYAYTLFPLMAHANFSALTDDLQSIVNRIEMFIGIFMLFVVAFSVLKYMIDPDKEQTNASKLVYKIVVSVVLLVSSSLIFGLLDDLQDALTGKGSDNLIEVILAGPNSSLIPDKNASAYDSYLTVGKTISYNAFFAMYENNGGEFGKDKDNLISGNLSFISVPSHFMETFLDDVDNIWNKSKIRYEFPILAELLGLFLIIMFVMFAVDMGIRNFTLIFLRILFPIAALGYLVPKKGDEILSKYIKAYMTSYAELFVKTFMIYLLLYILLWIMNILFGSGTADTVFGDTGVSGITKVLLLILLIVALFMFFLKGFPKLMKDIFGVEMGSSLKSAFGAALGFATAAAGFAAGGIAGAVKGGKAGGFGAAIRGAAKGAGQMGKVGWQSGKSAASGHLVQAFNGMSTGYKNTRNNLDATKADAINEANAATKNYEEADKRAKELEEKAKAPGATEADKKRAKAARETADRFKKEALKKTEKARKLDKDYRNSLAPTSRKEEASMGRMPGEQASPTAEVDQPNYDNYEYDSDDFATPIFDGNRPTVVVTPTVPSPNEYEYDMDDFATPQFEMPAQEIVVEAPTPQFDANYKPTDTSVVTPEPIKATTQTTVQQPTQQTVTPTTQQTVTTTSEQRGSAAKYEQEVVQVTDHGVTYTGTDGQVHVMPSATNLTSKDTPASQAERQDASEYSTKMNEVKETTSKDARSTIETTINKMGKTEVVSTNRTAVYENAGGGSTGGSGYTIYTGNDAYENIPSGSFETYTDVTENGGTEIVHDETVVRGVPGGTEYTGTDGKKHILKRPSWLDRPDADERNKENLDEKTKKERLDGLRSKLNKKRVANRTIEIVTEDGGSTESAYRQAEDEDLEDIDKRVEELIKEGLSEAEAIDKALKEYEERA